MPIHTSSNVDADSSSVATLLSRAGPIANPPPLTTERYIRDILQREQDHAMSLLDLSPLLADLFLSYANRAAALEPESAASSPESEERRALREIITRLLEENQKLKSETRGMVRKLRATEVSQEVFRSRASFIKEANTSQLDDVSSLRGELVQVEDEYDRFMADSGAERAALRVELLDLEAQRGELKETIVDQQTKISKLERQGFHSPSSPLTTIMLNEHDNCGGLNTGNVTTRIAKAEERAERVMMREMEMAKRECREQTEKAAREGTIKRVERWLVSVAEREARERDQKAETRALSPLSSFFTRTTD